METTVLKEESRKNKNGYRIIIKNLDTGEEEVNEITRAIIGAYQTELPKGEEGIAVQSVAVTSCNTATLIATIEGASKVVEETKKRVVKQIGDVSVDALLSLFGEER